MIDSIWFQFLLLITGVILGLSADHQLKRPRIKVQLGGYHYEAGHKVQHLLLSVTNRPIGRRLRLLRGEDAENLTAKLHLYGKSSLGLKVTYFDMKWISTEEKINPALLEQTKIPSNSYGSIRLLTYIKNVQGYQLAGVGAIRTNDTEKFSIHISNRGNVDGYWNITMNNSKNADVKDIKFKIKKQPSIQSSHIRAMYGGYMGYVGYLLTGRGKKF